MSTAEMGFDPSYDDNKTANVLYLGKNKENSDGSSYRKVEVLIDQEESYLSKKNNEHGSKPVNFSIKDEIVLYRSEGGQQKIHCWLIESKGSKSINAISISRRTDKGVYGSQEITLTIDAIVALRKFLDNLFNIDTKTIKSPYKIPLSKLNCSVQSSFSQIISEEQFIKLIKANIKNTDDFYKLISLQKMEIAIEQLKKILSGVYENEIEIQKFLRDNVWMFGNDYAFVIEGNKINAKNILDIVPKDIENYIDIIEVKLPKEKLFNYDESHKNYYSTSNLTKAIAQTQNYIFELENKSNDDEYQQINSCRIIRPRGIIIYGSDHELNIDEKKYLRVLNASYHNLQIITYQQLLEKAQNTISVIDSVT